MSAQNVSASEGSVDIEVKQLLQGNEKPFVTATDIAEELEVTRQYAHQRLSALKAAGEIQREEVGAKAVVWWLED